MRLGIGSYTYFWGIGKAGYRPERPLTVFDLLDRASELGVTVVQVCDNLPLTALSAADLGRFGDEARGRGISVEVGTRGVEVENLRANLRVAVEVGSPIVRVVATRTAPRPQGADVADAVRPLVPEIVAAGVRLAIENTEALPSRELARVVEDLGTESVGICMDTVNSLGAQETWRTVVDTLAPYCLNLHIKDFTIRRADYQVGFVVEGRPAGKGWLDIPWLLGRIRAAGRDPNAILELWTPPVGSHEETIASERRWAEDSITYLRTLVPE